MADGGWRMADGGPMAVVARVLAQLPDRLADNCYRLKTSLAA